ncbi:EamA family transporter [Defluviimonas sp. SAOS-178_SWC]|uniref:EamA family transporter n=1 Tax=Defluviimonas sp. SAOS-178_SWC TaxID=3121287 RepID=UPI003221E384
MAFLTSSWQIWAILAALFAAATAILAKIGVDSIAPDLATLIRTVVVAVLLTGLVLATGQGRGLGAIAPRSWLFLTLSGFATGASWLCYFRALKLGPASQVAPIDKLSVVFVALLGVAFLGERLSLTAWTGIGLITAGAVLVAVGN